MGKTAKHFFYFGSNITDKSSVSTVRFASERNSTIYFKKFQFSKRHMKRF